MTQLTLAITQGKNKMEACLERTRQEVSDWPEKAGAALQKFIHQHKLYGRGVFFTSEEAVLYCYEHGLTKAHDDRAWGNCFVKLARAGVIRKSDKTYRRTRGHGSPAFYWEII